MSIRKYKEADFNRLAEIYNVSKADEFYAEKINFKFTAWAEDKYMMSILEESDIYVYEKDEILGFCGSTGNRINWLCVDPMSRGQGIANQLLLYVISQLKSGVTLSVWKSNQRAKNLYKKHGFRILREFHLNFQGKEILVNTMVYP